MRIPIGFTLLVLIVLATPAGAQLEPAWVARYDGPGHGEDSAYDLEVDDAGNTYVFGHSQGIDSAEDYTTLKYDRSGVLQWERRYNGPGNGFDYGFALALDGAGNVLVSGYSLGAGTAGDATTMKYDPDGNLLWERRYDQAGQTDVGYDVEADDAGNVYVTGWSSIGSEHGFNTLKYDADGNLLWQRRYDGPGGPYPYNADLAYDLELDASGNVYVGGLSNLSETDDDYTAVKYDSDGNLQWARHYDGPGHGFDWSISLAVDPSGNSHITGWSQSAGGDYDIATLKYDTNGDLLWERRYDGSASSDDAGNDVQVDGEGNVLVTGFSDSSVWGDSCLTLKYSPDGILSWAMPYGPTNEGSGDKLAFDPAGNVYVTGYFWGGWLESYDYATLQYSAGGSLLAERRYNGEVSGQDDSLGIAIDPRGNVHVTGRSLGMGTGLDFVTVKYLQPGTLAVGLDALPASGTVPFATQFTAALINLTAASRRAAGRIDVVTGNGSAYSNWRSGWTNLSPAETFTSTWSQTIPAIGAVIGDNVFTLIGQDVTPSPYNQPPYAPSGDSAVARVTVTATN